MRQFDMKSAIKMGLACVAVIFAGSPTFAARFNCAATGHDYEFVDKTCNITWTAARDDAIASGGYLVTVTSAEEQACLEANAVSGSRWTAGSDAAVEDVWIWAAGPEAGRQFWQGKAVGSPTAPDNYANWIDGEPNSSAEDYMVWNTGGGWNDVGITNPIVCGYVFEGDPRPELVFEHGFESTPKRIFLSSQQYDGDDLGSATGGDAACQALADAQSLGGTWMAWLSDSGTSPDARFAANSDGYILLDGTLVASDYVDLTDGALAALINMNELGATVTNATKLRTWTATTIDGTFLGGSCSDWTSTSGVGRHGTATDEALGTPSWWTNRGQNLCTNSYSLYCFEQ